MCMYVYVCMYVPPDKIKYSCYLSVNQRPVSYWSYHGLILMYERKYYSTLRVLVDLFCHVIRARG